MHRLLSDGVLKHVPPQDKHLPDGVGIMQFSENVEYSEIISLSVVDVRELVLYRCFFEYLVCSSHWSVSKHRLRSFFVVQLPDEHTKRNVRNAEYRRFKYANRHFYIVGNNGDLSSLTKMFRNWQRRNTSLFSTKKCRIDYFTKNPWIDLSISHQILSILEKAQLSVSFCIHPKMVYSDKDVDCSLFGYILRDASIRRYINGEN